MVQWSDSVAHCMHTEAPTSSPQHLLLIVLSGGKVLGKAVLENVKTLVMAILAPMVWRDNFLEVTSVYDSKPCWWNGPPWPGTLSLRVLGLGCGDATFDLLLVWCIGTIGWRLGTIGWPLWVSCARLGGPIWDLPVIRADNTDLNRSVEEVATRGCIIFQLQMPYFNSHLVVLPPLFPHHYHHHLFL